MVLGLKGKNRRGGTVQIDYKIHVQDIKPWPPSQSLKSLRSVLLQWENGDRHSGSTNLVVPTLGSIVGEGKIEFNESFKLPVTLLKDMSVRGKDSDTFLKNCLEFNLYETRREKAAKGQLLASAIIDLAEFGVVRETLSVSTPLNCQRNFKNTLQPVLSIKIQPIDKGRTNNSLRETLSRGMSPDSNGGESVSASIRECEEDGEENEIASFTDDDDSSHSSVTVSSALDSSGQPLQTEENGLKTLVHGAESRQEHALVPKLDSERSNVTPEGRVRGDPIEQSSDPGSPENGHTSMSSSPNVGLMEKNDKKSYVVYFSSPSQNKQKENAIHSGMRNGDYEQLSQESNEMDREEYSSSSDVYDNSMEDNGGKISRDSREEVLTVETKKDSADDPFTTRGDIGKHFVIGSDAMSFGNENVETKSIAQRNDRLKHVKSVRSSSESIKCNGSGYKQLVGVEEIGAQGDSKNSLGSFRNNERKDSKVYAKDTKNAILDSKVQQLQHKIKMLEGELREAAAIESALYSVVAEHGSSMSKVHAPARRLSRLYLHSCKENFHSRKAYAARSAVSGFALIAKACGNDVPRLTFWLSNSVVLRTIISQAATLRVQVSSGSFTSKNLTNREINMTASPLKWRASSPNRRENRNAMYESFGDWEDTRTFTSALEKVEAWIFSRIIESIWWQTLTPHMQSATEKTATQVSSPTTRKNCKRSSSSVDQDQGNFSLDHWKKAFRDACERICPVRAGGHECGCLPLLSRLIMEQCVARLDVAMFNAILRDSADEIPTDPVSDPISESKVLPIPAGRSSFGAGAQLKNAIGNWSRWLTDLFGLDDDDQSEEENDIDDRKDTSFKSFYLLNALSDLMMLPKDMLLSSSIRKEVCPLFGAPVIKRVLEHFVPDEFCPEPMPDAVFEALDVEEDPSETDNDPIMNLPCQAAPISYHPTSAASVAALIGEVGTKSELRRSGSSVLRKSYTSDDELDELNSPLASILDVSISPSTPAKPSRISEENRNQNAMRYKLLRDVWLNSE